MVIISLHVQMRKARQGAAAAGKGAPPLPQSEALPAPKPGSISPAALSPLAGRPPAASAVSRSPIKTTLFDHHLTPKSEDGSNSSPSSKRATARTRSLGADDELRGTLHTLLGAEWKELEYGENGKPKSFVPSKNGLGRRADALLAELADASQPGQTMILARLMLQTNARLDKLTDALMSGGDGGGSFSGPSSSPFEA